jgi:hypothetical protein
MVILLQCVNSSLRYFHWKGKFKTVAVNSSRIFSGDFNASAGNDRWIPENFSVSVGFTA